MIRRALGPSAAGALVFLAACAAPWVGLFGAGGTGDMPTFRLYGERMTHGLWPYRSFFFDWPPGSVVPVLLPALPGRSYYAWFHVVVAAFAICALVATAAALVAVRAHARRVYAAVAAAAALPLALGAISVNSLDWWPSLLTIAALAALAAGRDRLGFALLGAAVITKIYPLVIVPPALLWIWRRHGRAAAIRAFAVGTGVVAVVAVPFAVAGLSGLGYSTRVQFARGLQMESLGASLLMALDRLGLHRVHVVVSHAPYSLDVAGGAASTVAVLSTVVLLAALLLVYLAYAAGPDEPQRLLTAAAAAVAACVAFNRVLSPQYLVWLFPLVPLVAGSSGLVATALLFVACGLTMTWFPGRFWHLVHVSPVSWFVLGRNVLLVAAFLVVVRPLLRTRMRPLGEPVAALRAALRDYRRGAPAASTSSRNRAA